jgi:hypothetical protein
VQKEGIEVAHSGIKGERVEVAPTEPVAAATDAGKKRKKVVEEAVEKAGDAPWDMEAERVEVASTEPAAAATVEVAVVDEVPVKKARDAPEAPLGIEEERMVEVW